MFQLAPALVRAGSTRCACARRRSARWLAGSTGIGWLNSTRAPSGAASSAADRTLADFAEGCSPSWKVCGGQKTVGAGISPSASLSDQDTVAAATSLEMSRHAGLDFDGPASHHPRAMPVPGHAVLHSCELCSACHRRFLPSFMAASVRRWRSHAFRGPVGLGIRPSNRQACSRFGPYGPQEIRLFALPFGVAIGSRLRWVKLTPGKGFGEWARACG